MLVAEAWKTIRRFVDSEFPQLESTLLPGAAAAEIEALEEKLVFRLPEDLRASLTICNGQADELGLFDFKHLFGCSEILSHFSLAREIYSETGPAHPSERPTTDRIDTSVGWGAGWAPFAGFQCSLVVADCVPPVAGRFGQVFQTEYQVPSEVLYESFSEWLAHYAKAFSEGKFSISAGVPVIYGHQVT